jgi:TatD DNase family protein
MLIDTHCHLNDPSFRQSLTDVVTRANAAGVAFFIVPAYDSESLERTAELARTFPGVIFPAFGVHPWFINDRTNYNEILFHLRNNTPAAIGEIGLDFSPECPGHDMQREALVRQLDWAAELQLPVILHCRKAHDTLLDILLKYSGRIHGVMHSFSGGKERMLKYIELGFYISFSGSVSRKTAKKYHQCAEAVPLERLLIETDAPSIATETTMASAVEPRHTVEIAHKLAEIRQIPFADVCAASTDNARQLFNLP